MAWVHQYYICLNCNFKDKLCSLFLLPFHCSHSYIHRVRLRQMLCSVPVCVLTLNSLSFHPNQFSSLYFFLLLTSPSFFLWSNSLHPPVSACIPQSVLFAFLPYLFIISYFLPFYLLSISCLSPTPQPGLAVYKASTLSSALWLMLYRSHPSPQCHHSAFKIQSFSETAVVHHLSSPPFWLWLRGTIGMASWRPA